LTEMLTTTELTKNKVTPKESSRDSLANMRDELKTILAEKEHLPIEQLPELLSELAHLMGMVLVRLMRPEVALSPPAELVPIEVAAQRLGLKVDYLYHHYKKLFPFPFSRKIRGKLRFSSVAIEEYIRRQSTLTARHQHPTISPTVDHTVKEIQHEREAGRRGGN